MSGGRFFLPGALAAWLLAALPAGAQPQGDEQGAETASLRSFAPLARQLDPRLAAVESAGDIRVGVAVETLEGAPVYSWSGDRLRVLASNNKLLTTSAALLRLGPGYRWRTSCFLDGDRLWIRGGGDPSLRTLQGAARHEQLLDELARALRARGVQALAELVVDDRFFDREFRHPEWPANQWHYEYCAPVAGLALEGGCLAIRGLPGGRLEISPDLSGQVDLDVKLSASRASRQALSAWWREDRQGLVVRGNLLSEQTVLLAAADPLDVVQWWLLCGLEKRGVACGRVRLAGSGEDEPGGEALLVFESAWTLAEAVALANLDSDNFVSETLLKTLGREVEGEGSFAAGARAVRAVLEEDAGLDPGPYQPTDGSGLARNAAGTANRSSPEAICALLRAMAQTDAGPVIFDSLPIGGQPGKLASRFRADCFQPGRVRAKTGWIKGASSLSGFLLAPDETVLVFSVVVNYERDGTPRTNNASFKALQEEILAEVVLRW